MNLATLTRYLLGYDDAIRTVARHPRAVWLGLALVLTAGLAREYDLEDLVHQPWHALIPIPASLATSFILYVLLQLYTRVPAEEPRQFWLGYRQFLGLYWLMAPMAWLYAFPAERMLSAGDSVRCNLALLAVVSLWRVVLMTRVIQVLWKTSAPASAIVVLFFAANVTLAAMALSPTPIFNVMGGIRLSDAENVILGTKLFVTWGILLLWLPLFIGLGSIAVWNGWFDRPEWTPNDPPPQKIHPAVWSLPAVVAVLFGGLMFFTQPEQLRRHHAERLLYAERIDEAVQFMAEVGMKNFPPHWDPPPRVAYFDGNRPPLRKVLEAHVRKPFPPEIAEVFEQKALALGLTEYGSVTEDTDVYLDVFMKRPDAEKTVRSMPWSYANVADQLPDDSPHKAQLKAWLTKDDAERSSTPVP